jgi:nicotinate-nucleotide adenylyltransferase
MPTLTEPIGILGGTFDPIHIGHLRIAEEVADALALQAVRIIPSGTPPHRPPPTFSAEQRLRFCELATRGNPRLHIDAREVHKTTASYTVETLEQLRAERPFTPIILILGADAFLGLPSWHRWTEVLALAHIALVARPGVELVAKLPTPLQSVYAERIVSRNIEQAVRAKTSGAIVPVEVTALDISATRIRARLKQNQSVRYLVPDALLSVLQRS